MLIESYINTKGSRIVVHIGHWPLENWLQHHTDTEKRFNTLLGVFPVYIETEPLLEVDWMQETKCFVDWSPAFSIVLFINPFLYVYSLVQWHYCKG